MQSEASTEEIRRIFLEFVARSGDGKPNNDNGADTRMSLDAFATFLLSPENSVMHSRHRKVCQDMNRPLPEYYVSSSHNTYLVGNQWKGESTVEGYVRALLAGCRSVESESVRRVKGYGDTDSMTPVRLKSRLL